MPKKPLGTPGNDELPEVPRDWLVSLLDDLRRMGTMPTGFCYLCGRPLDLGKCPQGHDQDPPAPQPQISRPDDEQ